MVPEDKDFFSVRAEICKRQRDTEREGEREDIFRGRDRQIKAGRCSWQSVEMPREIV